MKYIDRLNQTAEDSAKANNELAAETAKLSIMNAMLQCKKNIHALKAQQEKNKASTNFDVSRILAGYNAIALAERELKIYEELEKELF